MKNKYQTILLIIICIFTLTGCDNNDTKGMKLVTCERKTEQMKNMDAELKYKIYHDGTYIKKTISTEKVTSSDRTILKQYKEAYEKVFKPYKDIEYYDNEVTTTSNSVTSTTIINYEKVDYKKILALEGEDGNIYETDGKVKLETLVNMYEKYGATCK